MKSSANCLCVFILLITIQMRSTEAEELLIQTSTGPIRGIRLMSESGKPVLAFLGIPYGKAPLGNHRFQHPEPADPWEEVFEANKKPDACYQYIQVENPPSNIPKTVSEDCLKLNIWVPYSRPLKAAVMVWIHGGAFIIGSSNLERFDMKMLASEESIIAVSINYRLSAFGFLYLDHPEAPGNAGLYDQALALQWLKQNIAQFGGDENRITLFGSSAGSASVGFHLLSPVSRGLFARAIMQGGSPNTEYALHNHSYAVSRAMALAEFVGCTGGVDWIIACLQQKDPKHLTFISETNRRLLPYAPVVDGKLVKEIPSKLLESAQFEKASLLIGTCKDEGSMFILEAPGFSPFKEVYLTRSMFLETIPYVSPDNSLLSQKAIDFEYTDWSDPYNLEKNTEAIELICGDTYITCPSIKFAFSFMKEDNEVYQYEFRRRPSNSTDPKWMGVVHTTEDFFVFGKPLDKNGTFPAEEVVFTRRIMRYWANFARTGNPNISPTGGRESIEWPKHTFRREFLPLKDQRDKPETGLRIRKCQFWSKYLPGLIDTKEAFEKVESSSRGNYFKHSSKIICVILNLIILLQKRIFS